jgi:hypothetical protein
MRRREVKKSAVAHRRIEIASGQARKSGCPDLRQIAFGVRTAEHRQDIIDNSCTLCD